CHANARAGSQPINAAACAAPESDMPAIQQSSSSETTSEMPITRDQLFARLDELGIETQTVEHPPAFTVADSSAIEIPLTGAHTKNLFLKDDEGTLVLVVAKSTTRVD